MPIEHDSTGASRLRLRHSAGAIATATLILIGMLGATLNQFPMGEGLPGVHHAIVGSSALALAIMYRRQIPDLSRETWLAVGLLACLTAWALVAALMSPFRTVALIHTARFAPLIAFGGALVLVASDHRRRPTIMSCAYAFLLLLALSGFASPWLAAAFPDAVTGGFKWSSSRITGLTQNPNQFGVLMVLAVVFWSAARRNRQGAWHWTDVLILLPVTALVVSGSRNAWIIFLGALVLLYLARLERSRMLLALLIVFVTVTALSPAARDRLSTIPEWCAPTLVATATLTSPARAAPGSSTATPSSDSQPVRGLLKRMPYWRHALDKGVQRPVLGWGYGVFRTQFAEAVGDKSPGLTPHNVFLLAFVSTGIVGLGLVLALTALTIRWALRNSAHLSILLLLGTGAQMVDEFSHSWPFVMTLSAVAALAITPFPPDD